MRKLKVLISSLIVMTLLAGTVAVGAASSPSKTKFDPAKDKIEVESSNAAYGSANGYVKLVVNGKSLVEGVDYVVTYNKNIKKLDAGTYELIATIKGVGHYEGTITKKVKVVIAKKAQKFVKKTVKTRKVKASKLKKKKIKIKLKVKTNGKGKLVFKRKSKKIKVSKKGVVTLKKGLKKGTYKIKVMAKATKNFKKTKWKVIKIKVK